MYYSEMTNEETTEGAYVQGSQLVFVDDSAYVRGNTLYIE